MVAETGDLRFEFLQLILEYELRAKLLHNKSITWIFSVLAFDYRDAVIY